MCTCYSLRLIRLSGNEWIDEKDHISAVVDGMRLLYFTACAAIAARSSPHSDRTTHRLLLEIDTPCTSCCHV